MTIATPADAIIVPGKVDILVAFPSAYTSLFKLGESEDSITVRKRPFFHDVPGDRYGGQGGPPIEKQFLGYTADFELKMSRWDPAQLAKIESIGGLLATNGTVPLAVIGATVLATRGIRILLYCTRDTTQTINFPCCTFEQPITVGKQTKYSSCGMGITANRAPEGYWEATKAGVVWDADVLGMTV